MLERPIRVILVEDHALVLDMLVATIESRPEFEVVAKASSVAEGEQLVRTVAADVLVTDLQLGDGRGTELVEPARQRNPPIAVLLITGEDDVRAVNEAIQAGCSGFVSKTQAINDLGEAIIALARGAAVFPAELLYRSIDEDAATNADQLSPRELEILQLLAEANTVPDIARTIHLSVHTVRNHVKQILAKLGAHSQLQAVVFGARRGYIQVS